MMDIEMALFHTLTNVFSLEITDFVYNIETSHHRLMLRSLSTLSLSVLTIVADYGETLH